MAATQDAPRFQMVNVRPGHVIIEQEIRGARSRAWFSDEPVPPKEEYREGEQIWRYAGTAQSMRFDVRDSQTGQVTSFAELLGLLYHGSAKPESVLRRVGEVAEQNRIFVYVAIAYENSDGSPRALASEKIEILNRLFNERLATPNKKILILPDLFDLGRAMSYGEIMIDFGLTSMEQGDGR